MGQVFHSKSSVWSRLRQWLSDLFGVLFALPSYINPEPLKPAPLSAEERAEAEKLLAEEDGDWVLSFMKKADGQYVTKDFKVYWRDNDSAVFDIKRAAHFESKADAEAANARYEAFMREEVRIGRATNKSYLRFSPERVGDEIGAEKE